MTHSQIAKITGLLDIVFLLSDTAATIFFQSMFWCCHYLRVTTIEGWHFGKPGDINSLDRVYMRETTHFHGWQQD